jgi:hypothetical protein
MGKSLYNSVHYCLLASLIFSGLLTSGSASVEHKCRVQNDMIRCDAKETVKLAETIYTILRTESCAVKKMRFSGESSSKSMRFDIISTYECLYSAKVGSGLSTPVKVKEEGTKRYQFDCDSVTFRVFSSGFDFFDNGNYMHWDGQMSWDTMWKALAVGDAATKELYELMCEPVKGLDR